MYLTFVMCYATCTSRWMCPDFENIDVRVVLMCSSYSMARSWPYLSVRKLTKHSMVRIWYFHKNLLWIIPSGGNQSAENDFFFYVHIFRVFCHFLCRCNIASNWKRKLEVELLINAFFCLTFCTGQIKYLRAWSHPTRGGREVLSLCVNTSIILFAGMLTGSL